MRFSKARPRPKTGSVRPTLLALALLALSGAAAAEDLLPPVGEPAASAHTVERTLARGPLFYPDGPGEFAWRFGLGALVDVLPRRIVESAQRQVPHLTAHARFGLPAGFSLDARLAAILLSNQLEVGVAWTHRVGPVVLSIQDHQGLWVGFVGLQGFDATGWGFLNKPGLAVGLPMGAVRFTLAGEALYTFGQHVRLGSTNLARGELVFAGTGLTLTVENLLDSGHLWYFGVAVVRASPNYEAWLALSDERAHFPYPRFFGGYAF